MEQMPSQRLLAATWKLFNASLEAGLTLLIQTASEIYQAPVVYTNELFQIRAMYPKNKTIFLCERTKTERENSTFEQDNKKMDRYNRGKNRTRANNL